MVDNREKNILFIGNGFDIEHGIKIEWKEFVNSAIFKKNMQNYKKYFNEDYYNQYFKNSILWSEFENFCKIISENNNIKKRIFYQKISVSFSKWIAEEKIKIKEIKESELIQKILKKESIKTIISFNFTNTPEIYGFQKKEYYYKSFNSEWLNEDSWIGKYLLLHHFPSKQESKTGTCVIGHDDEEKYNKNYQIEFWNNKKTNLNHKSKVLDRIGEINPNKIFFFGFSFGDSDGKTIEFLKKQKNIKFEIFHLKNEKPINLKGKRGIKYNLIEKYI